MTHDLMLIGLAALVLLAGGFCIGDWFGLRRGYREGFSEGKAVGTSAGFIRAARGYERRRSQ